ncbi:MAG: ATPase, T2SS/T4P/T4SS family [Candidatus Omnitrophica bacterium]|nr:ATPase, T2SS/T4P/T4SS family [Candidatus Omnitrophota bacterium]
MNNKIDSILYDMLISEKIVEQNLLDRTVADHPKYTGQEWIQYLVKEHGVDENKVMELLAHKIGITYGSLKNKKIEEKVLEKVSIKIASYYQFMPLSIKENILSVGVYYPMDIKVQDEIRFQLGYDIDQHLTTKDEIIELLRTNYGFGAQTIEEMFLKGESKHLTERFSEQKSVEDLDIIDKDPTVANLVNQIILDAHKKRATDIHIEPYRGRVRFRYRIDGKLYDAKVSDQIKHFISPILSRIKIMSNLDIVEHRLPQDGQAVVKTKFDTIDLRVSFIPSLYGESVVVRLLPQKALYTIEKLGLYAHDKELLDEMLTKPNGIIFVTGPTGSGKTTTLYACLNKLNTKDRKIITIEDPVEYEMPNVTQIQVNNNIGLTFANGLRSVLRHDPDIMMVGEVRDMETAEIAVRIALTGHLMFSTLHTNSAAGSIHRLIDIGIEPYLIQSSTIAFIAQRLIRVLCPDCKRIDKQPKQQTIDLIRSMLPTDEKIVIYEKVGCDKCNHTGYYGRTAIYEILPIDPDIKELIQQNASVDKIEKKAIENGMASMVENGIRKVLDGVTTIDEIMNVLAVIVTKQSGRLSVNGVGVRSGGTETAKEDFSNRRVYKRLDAHLPMVFSIHRNVSDELQRKMKEFGISEEDYWKEHTAVTEDISAGGLHFKTTLNLLEGTVLDVKIVIPINDEGNTKEVSCLAKVVRISEVEKNSLYGIAKCFLDMSIEDRNILKDFIDKKIKTQQTGK